MPAKKRNNMFFLYWRFSRYCQHYTLHENIIVNESWYGYILRVFKIVLRLFHFMHYVNNKICYCSMETIILIVFLSHVDFMFYFVYHSRVLHSFKIVLLLLIFYIRYDLLLLLSLMSNSIHSTSCMKIFCKLE